MIALLNQIPTEAKIKKHLKKIIFGKNVFCPHCHSRKIYKSENRFRCRKCRKPFTLLSGTWLNNMKLSYRTFWALLWCWTQRIPVLQTQKLCHVSEKTIYLWFRQFRLHLPEFEPILQGKVQMDEAYFKSLSLVMAKQVGTKKLAHQIIFKNSVDKSETTKFLFQHVEPKTVLQTDGAGVYKNIDQWWQVKHKVDIHRKFQFGLTSEIEGIFGNLRTFIRRMYHHVTPEYLPEYVSEFCIRFSSPEIFNSPLTYLEKSL
ncbi:IS1595 family transposase [Patescibacteria group bacterium]|nr:IS1595 family transposase [Patescibacteria group bacterium]